MKRRIIAAVMAIGCAVSLWFGTGINGRAMTDLDVSEVVSKSIQEPEERDLQDMNISINEQEWMILYYTNGIRMANGLQPLSTFGALQSACDVRANELGTLFDHTRPNGTDCYSVLDEMGISYMSGAENIAAGRTDPWDRSMTGGTARGTREICFQTMTTWAWGISTIHIRRMGIIGYSYSRVDVPHRASA